MEFTLRDVYRNNWTGLGTPKLARIALETLEDTGWVRPIVAAPGTKGRRPELYALNAKVRHG